MADLRLVSAIGTVTSAARHATTSVKSFLLIRKDKTDSSVSSASSVNYIPDRIEWFKRVGAARQAMRFRVKLMLGARTSRPH